MKSTFALHELNCPYWMGADLAAGVGYVLVQAYNCCTSIPARRWMEFANTPAIKWHMRPSLMVRWLFNA